MGWQRLPVGHHDFPVLPGVLWDGLFGNRGAMAVQQVETNDLSQVERDILAGNGAPL